MKGQILYSQTYGENQMCSFSTRLITDIEVSNVGDAVVAAKEISLSRKDEMIDLIIDGKDYASYKNGYEYKKLPEEIEAKIKKQSEDSKEKMLLKYYKDSLCCESYTDMYLLLNTLEQLIMKHYPEEYKNFTKLLMA